MSEFFRFLVTGGIAAGVNLLTRYVFNLVIPFEAAVALAFIAGMAVSYVLTRTFVFGASGRSIKSEFKRFAVVNAVAIVLVWVISVGLARVIFPSINFRWHSDDIAHFFGVLAPAITSYFGHRRYTFARGSDQDTSI